MSSALPTFLGDDVDKAQFSALIELGLSEKEAQVYLAALKRGGATAQLLSLESGIKRATVYGCIESLIAKGLLHTEIKGVRKLFIPETPAKLAALLEQKKQVLANIMPQLTQQYLHAAPNINTIKIYHGLTGIKSIYDHILDELQPNDEYLVISDHQKWLQLDSAYFDNFTKKRDKIGLILRLILKDTRLAKDYKKKVKEKIKILPGHIDLNVNMVILPSKVIILQTIEPLLAIVIENQSIAAMNKALFNIIWELM